jgi:hypothetical protein
VLPDRFIAIRLIETVSHEGGDLMVQLHELFGWTAKSPLSRELGFRQVLSEAAAKLTAGNERAGNFPWSTNRTRRSHLDPELPFKLAL